MTTPRMEPNEIVESINQCVDMTWSALEDHGHDRPGDHEREDWFDSFHREAVHCVQTLDNSFARLAEWNRNPEPPSIDFVVSKYRQEMLDRIRDVCGPSELAEL